MRSAWTGHCARHSATPQRIGEAFAEEVRARTSGANRQACVSAQNSKLRSKMCEEPRTANRLHLVQHPGHCHKHRRRSDSFVIIALVVHVLIAPLPLPQGPLCVAALVFRVGLRIRYLNLAEVPAKRFLKTKLQRE